MLGWEVPSDVSYDARTDLARFVTPPLAEALAKARIPHADALCSRCLLRAKESSFVARAVAGTRLCAQDSAALACVCGDADAFDAMNSALASADPTRLLAANALLCVFLRALRGLPQIQPNGGGGCFFRASKTRPRRALRAGDDVVWHAFAPVTPSKAAAERSLLLCGQQDECCCSGVLYVVRDAWGYNVTPFVADTEECTHVLLEAGLRFRVDAVSETGALLVVEMSALQDKHPLVLEELFPPYAFSAFAPSPGLGSPTQSMFFAAALAQQAASANAAAAATSSPPPQPQQQFPAAAVEEDAPHAVESLWRLLDNPATCSAACRDLCTQAVSAADSGGIGREGGIALLVSALRRHSKSPEVCQAACRGLKTLAATDSNRVSIICEGAIPLVLAALCVHVDSSGVCLEACNALCNIAEEDGEQVAIAKADGIAIVLAALKRHADNPAVRDAACNALRSLAESPANKRTILKRIGADPALQHFRHDMSASSVELRGVKPGCTCTLQ